MKYGVKNKNKKHWRTPNSLIAPQRTLISTKWTNGGERFCVPKPAGNAVLVGLDCKEIGEKDPS